MPGKYKRYKIEPKYSDDLRTMLEKAQYGRFRELINIIGDQKAEIEKLKKGNITIPLHMSLQPVTFGDSKLELVKLNFNPLKNLFEITVRTMYKVQSMKLIAGNKRVEVFREHFTPTVMEAIAPFDSQEVEFYFPVYFDPNDMHTPFTISKDSIRSNKKLPHIYSGSVCFGGNNFPSKYNDLKMEHFVKYITIQENVDTGSLLTSSFTYMNENGQEFFESLPNMLLKMSDEEVKQLQQRDVSKIKNAPVQNDEDVW